MQGLYGLFNQVTFSICVNYLTSNFRIFVNRSLTLEKIKFYGFDMDYTLAEYKSEEVIWFYTFYKFVKIFNLLVWESWLWVSEGETDSNWLSKGNFKHQIQTKFSGKFYNLYKQKWRRWIQVRGLWWDNLHGNMLKVDGFGNILFCCHGLKFLKA